MTKEKGVETHTPTTFVPNSGDRVKITEVYGESGNHDESFFVGRICTVGSSQPYIYPGVALSDGQWAVLMFADDGKCGAYVRCEKAPNEVLLKSTGRFDVCGINHDNLCHTCGKTWGAHYGGAGCGDKATADCPQGGGKWKMPQVQEAPALSSRARVDKAMVQLGPNATALLADIADRLVIGKAHGDFEAKANWSKEAYEEDLDGIVYRAMKLRQVKAA